MIVVLDEVVVDDQGDVFVLRQRAREVAEGLGFDEGNQVRIATALSDLGRELLDVEGGAPVVFQVLLDGPTAVLCVEVRAVWPDRASLLGRPGFVTASRLLEVDIVEHALVLRKDLGRPLDAAAAQRLRLDLAETAVVDPLDVLRAQNQELVDATDRLTQLNAELEETNRGVVALYAELDAKTEELRHASEAKSRFLASVSHELRSPVTSVLGLSRLLLDPDDGELTEAQRRQVELIVGSAGDLLGLVNQLLDLAKAESGRLEPTVAAVDLTEVFAELRGTMRPLARDGVVLEVEDPEVPVLETDRTLLVHVLRNLVTNALKFTEAGSVRLRAERRESAQHVRISVEDTGIGIAPEDQPRVFEEFFQVRNLLQVDRPGTGLGLPYAHRVAAALGGSLSLESDVGVGSTFTLELPLQWEAMLGADRMPTPGSEPARIATALVVDDDEAFRHVLRGMLQGVAERVVEVTDGAEALAALRSIVADVVFLDLQMPNVDGHEVLRQLDADPALRDLRVVVVTSMDLDEVPAGAAAVLPKADVTRDAVLGVLTEERDR